MTELRVSATEMRVFLKDFANMVATAGGAVVMDRHGMTMAVLISYGDYQELLRFKQQRGKRPAAEVPREHPDHLPLEVVERIYRETEGVDDEVTQAWRARAGRSISARRRATATGPPS